MGINGGGNAHEIVHDDGIESSMRTDKRVISVVLHLRVKSQTVSRARYPGPHCARKWGQAKPFYIQSWRL